MIVNLGAIHDHHRHFIQANRRMIARTLDEAGKEAVASIVVGGGGLGFKNRTGTLIRGQRYIVLKSGILRLRNRAKHAGVLEHGSRAHVITPSRRKFLRFVVQGRTVFARRVNHPGTRAYRFLSGARDRAQIRVAALLHLRMAQLAAAF